MATRFNNTQILYYLPPQKKPDFTEHVIHTRIIIHECRSLITIARIL